MVRRKRLAIAVLHIVLAAAASAGEFIRVEEDATAARLQTAVTRYEKGDESVELIGAVHIADKAYYQALTSRFTGYDALLFEMIGGEKFANHQQPAAEADANNLSGLHKIYAMVAGFLSLTGQTENIDYTTQNFVHADLTQAEFTQMQTDRNESLIGFAMKAGKPDPDAPNQPDPAKLLRAMLSGSSNGVKLEIVHTLGRGDDQIAAFAGESVIITDRNQRCVDVIQKQLAAGHQHLGVFYGAAHFPDLAKRLLALGFKQTNQEWLTAWDIPKPAANPEVEVEADEAPAPELKKAS
jgi:hypothetical protein